MVQILEEHRDVENRRFVVGLADGGRVEAVLYRGDSLCVSSQVGCAVSCPFCASGANGLARNLSPEELRGQVEAVEARASGVRKITVSGVGEPLHNHQNVADFVAWCRARETPASITTSGGPLRRLKEWFSLPHNGISFSIHAGTEETRARMVPKGPALGPLFDTLHESLKSVSHSKRRKLALAYLVLADKNDSDEEIEAFLARARPLGLKIHLYAYNPVPTSNERRVDEARYQAIYEAMRSEGLDVRRSSQARVEKNGGCGTLIAQRPLQIRTSTRV